MYSEPVILIVGVDSAESRALAGMLGDAYHVMEAEASDHALTHASGGVDLVICELDSPRNSALSLLEKWRQQDKQTPFLFVTSGAHVASVIEGMKLGADDCLVRPINASDLRETVSRLLNSDYAATGRANARSNRPPDDQNTNIDIPPGTSLEDLERAAVEQALMQHHGNRTHAAKTLGISVRTLQRKLKAWGMPLMMNSYSPLNPPHAKFLFTEQHSPPVPNTQFSGQYL